jgi:hypothetical protein
MLTILSFEPETIFDPSDVKAKDFFEYMCPFDTERHFLVVMSQVQRFSSIEPEMILDLSGFTATEFIEFWII